MYTSGKIDVRNWVHLF